MTQPLNGIVHGKTITLDDDPKLDDGQRVQVELRPKDSATEWGQGIRRCAGVLGEASTDEDDRILSDIQKDRQRTSARDHH